MVEVNVPYEHDKYERIWLNSLHIMSKIKAIAIQDSRQVVCTNKHDWVVFTNKHDWLHRSVCYWNELKYFEWKWCNQYVEGTIYTFLTRWSTVKQKGTITFAWILDNMFTEYLSHSIFHSFFVYILVSTLTSEYRTTSLLLKGIFREHLTAKCHANTHACSGSLWGFLLLFIAVVLLTTSGILLKL